MTDDPPPKANIPTFVRKTMPSNSRHDICTCWTLWELKRYYSETITDKGRWGGNMHVKCFLYSLGHLVILNILFSSDRCLTKSILPFP